MKKKIARARKPRSALYEQIAARESAIDALKQLDISRDAELLAVVLSALSSRTSKHKPLASPLAARALETAIGLLYDAQELERLGADAPVYDLPLVRRVSSAAQAMNGHSGETVEERVDVLFSLIAKAGSLYTRAKDVRGLAELGGSWRERSEGIASGFEHLARTSFFEKLDALGLPARDPDAATDALERLLRTKTKYPHGGRGRTWTAPFRELWFAIVGRPLAWSDEMLRGRQEGRKQALARLLPESWDEEALREGERRRYLVPPNRKL